MTTILSLSHRKLVTVAMESLVFNKCNSRCSWRSVFLELVENCRGAMMNSSVDMWNSANLGKMVSWQVLSTKDRWWFFTDLELSTSTSQCSTKQMWMWLRLTWIKWVQLLPQTVQISKTFRSLEGWFCALLPGSPGNVEISLKPATSVVDEQWSRRRTHLTCGSKFTSNNHSWSYSLLIGVWTNWRSLKK